MRLLNFILGGLFIALAVGVTSGDVQKIVHFENVKSELGVFVVSWTMGLLLLIYSFKGDEKAN